MRMQSLLHNNTQEIEAEVGYGNRVEANKNENKSSEIELKEKIKSRQLCYKVEKGK